MIRYEALKKEKKKRDLVRFMANIHRNMLLLMVFRFFNLSAEYNIVFSLMMITARDIRTELIGKVLRMREHPLRIHFEVVKENICIELLVQVY